MCCIVAAERRSHYTDCEAHGRGTTPLIRRVRCYAQTELMTAQRTLATAHSRALSVGSSRDRCLISLALVAPPSNVPIHLAQRGRHAVDLSKPPPEVGCIVSLKQAERFGQRRRDEPSPRFAGGVPLQSSHASRAWRARG